MLPGFRGRGKAGYTSGNISHFVEPWKAGGPSPLKSARLSRTPQNTIHRCCVKHETALLCQARDSPAVSKRDKGYCVKAKDRLLSQSTRHMPGQNNRHTAVIKARDTCYVKARDALLFQTMRHTTVSKHDAGAVTHTTAVKHCCSVTAQHTKP